MKTNIRLQRQTAAIADAKTVHYAVASHSAMRQISGTLHYAESQRTDFQKIEQVCISFFLGRGRDDPSDLPVIGGDEVVFARRDAAEERRERFLGRVWRASEVVTEW